MLVKTPFRRYKLDAERNEIDEQPFTIRLTEKDKDWFLPAKAKIKQPKKSTAMKQLAQIGALFVLQDKKTDAILNIIGGNIRRNERIGIPESEYMEQETIPNVTQKQEDM